MKSLRAMMQDGDIAEYSVSGRCVIADTHDGYQVRALYNVRLLGYQVSCWNGSTWVGITAQLFFDADSAIAKGLEWLDR